MTKDDVRNIAWKQGFSLDDDEVDGIFYYVKNLARNFMNTKIDPDVVLSDLHGILREENYEKALLLYNKYKDKI